jgi:hypothetical protein
LRYGILIKYSNQIATKKSGKIKRQNIVGALSSMEIAINKREADKCNAFDNDPFFVGNNLSEYFHDRNTPLARKNIPTRNKIVENMF